MIHDSIHISDDGTADRIEQARSVRGIPNGQRLVPHANIGALLRARAAATPDKTWLIFHSEDKPRVELSYARFLEMVRRTAHMMHRYGVRRGDRICTVSYNHAGTVVQYFAAWLLGAVVVPVNTGEDDKRIAYIIANSGATFAFVRTQYIERIRHLRAEAPLLETIMEVGHDVSGTFPSFHTELELSDPGFAPPEEAQLADDALIVYTSGTTGLPKGVVLDQYNLLVDAQEIAAWHGMDASQRMMCVLPLHHVNGTVVTLLTPLSFGGSVVLNQKFHTGSFFQRLADEKVQVVSVVPTLLQYLLHEDVDISQLDLAGFRHIICGAGPLTCELAARFEERYGIPIVHGYGLSETTCYSCFLPVDLSSDEHRVWMQEHGFPSIGVALPCNEMDIQSPDGASLPEGERGEIVIRGHNVMRYYFQQPEANSSTFANGWFRSGDEGFVCSDAQGRRFFFITGRLKELIIRGGVNLAPLEIDEVINRCPGVKAGIAVGFDNDWYGEEVGALVHRSDDTLTEEQLLAHCRKYLPASKCPKVVIFSEDIPVTSTGKYQRNKVRHLFAEWKGVQFH
jgi:long-chain acyl-CoA synthetase